MPSVARAADRGSLGDPTGRRDPRYLKTGITGWGAREGLSTQPSEHVGANMIEFAPDSPLEGSGFELLVPP
jgi:hypothetical protein